jgi:hypothetical protein
MSVHVHTRNPRDIHAGRDLTRFGWRRLARPEADSVNLFHDSR